MTSIITNRDNWIVNAPQSLQKKNTTESSLIIVALTRYYIYPSNFLFRTLMYMMLILTYIGIGLFSGQLISEPNECYSPQWMHVDCLTAITYDKPGYLRYLRTRAQSYGLIVLRYNLANGNKDISARGFTPTPMSQPSVSAMIDVP